MNRRSLLASLAAFLAASLASFRSLSAARNPRPHDRGGYYRGFLTWKGLKAEARVLRPDLSFLEPLPVRFVEKELIMLRFKPWKYGIPVPEPGFAWGGGGGHGVGTGQLAAALLLDHTGDRELAALEARWFTDVLDALDTMKWQMPEAWIDEWLAEQQRLRSAGRLRCHGDGCHSFPIR